MFTRTREKVHSNSSNISQTKSNQASRTQLNGIFKTRSVLYCTCTCIVYTIPSQISRRQTDRPIIELIHRRASTTSFWSFRSSVPPAGTVPAGGTELWIGRIEVEGALPWINSIWHFRICGMRSTADLRRNDRLGTRTVLQLRTSTSYSYSNTNMNIIHVEVN